MNAKQIRRLNRIIAQLEKQVLALDSLISDIDDPEDEAHEDLDNASDSVELSIGELYDVVDRAKQ